MEKKENAKHYRNMSITLQMDTLAFDKKRDAFSQWGLIVLGIIIMVIKLLRTESPADIISILFCTSGLGFTYEGIKLRKKYTVACGIALLLASIYFFYKFCAGLF